MEPAALGVIFDIDGVLVDSYAAHFESWRRLARELGRDLSEAEFSATFGRTSREIIRALFGERLTDEQVRQYDERKEQFYRDHVRGRVPAMPGAIELVRRLHEAGLQLAIGSSGPPENVDLIMREMGLYAWFKAWITGADVTRGKPDPQVFQLAAQRLSLPPERCIVIEDAPVGIEAARRAGCKTVALVGTHPRESLQAADLVVDKLSDISVDALRRWPG